MEFIGRQGPPANSWLIIVQNPALWPDTTDNALNRAEMLRNCLTTSHELPAGASLQTVIWKELILS